MQDVQNLRKAIYECVARQHISVRTRSHVDHSYKLKVAASEKGSTKREKLLNIGINYLYVETDIMLSTYTDTACTDIATPH